MSDAEGKTKEPSLAKEASPRKLCPMRWTPKVTAQAAAGFDNCKTARCAWWDAEHKECAVLVIAIETGAS